MSFFSELKRRNVIRVATAYVVGSWLIIQVAETTFPAFGLGDTALRVLIILLGVAFIPTLVFSWAFELTPEGLKREVDVVREDSISRYTGKRIDRIIMVLLALALGYFLFDRLVLTPAREAAIVEQARQEGAKLALQEAMLQRAADKSVVVLPFINRSMRPEDQYFTDGIYDEVLTRLTSIGSLKVIARTSAMHYRDSNKPVSEIADELSVATALEGAVQRVGNQVRVQAQLINARTNENLWAMTFSREVTAENLFAMQSEIAFNIAAALDTELSPREEAQLTALPTDNLEAYEIYMRGRQHLASRRAEELKQAAQAFERAVELDPRFAQAWVGIADTIIPLGDHGLVRSSGHLEKRRQAIETALSLNDQLGEAWTSMAHLLRHERRREEAEAAYLRAIQLSPNYPQAYLWYGVFQEDVNNTEKALALYRKAAELDPLWSVAQIRIGSALVRLGRDDEALEQWERLLRLDPDFGWVYSSIARLHAQNGRLAEAVRWYREAVAQDPESGRLLANLHEIYQALGDYEAVAEVRERMNQFLGPDNFQGMALDFMVILDRSGWQEALRWLDELPPEWIDDPAAHRTRPWVYLIARDYPRAWDSWLKLEPRWEQPQTWPQVIDQYREACHIAGVQIEVGKTEMGEALLRQSLELMENEYSRRDDPTSPSSGLGFCYLIDGSYEKALDFFEQYVSRTHWVDYFWIFARQVPWWDPVRDHPRYIAMMDRIEAVKAEQRELLRQLDESFEPAD